MAIEKIINIVVNEIGFDSAEKSADSLNNSLKGLEKESEGLTESMSSNKDSLLENGGAMALLNEVTGGYAMTVKDAIKASALFSKESKIGQLAMKAYTFATTSATGATKALKVALISTGIGAIVVAITALVAAVYSYNQGVEQAKFAQEDFNAALEETNRLSKERIDSIAQELALEREMLRERGASIEQFRNAERKASKDRVDALRNEIAQLEALEISKDLNDEDRVKAIQDRANRIVEANNKIFEEYKVSRVREAAFRADDAEKQREEDKKNAEKSLEEQKKAAEKRKKLQEEEAEKRKQLEKETLEFIFALNQSYFDNNISLQLQKDELLKSFRSSSALTELEEQRKNALMLLDATNASAEERLQAEVFFENKRQQILSEKESERLEEIRNRFTEELNARQAFEDAKYNIASQGLDLISGLSGKSEAIAKGILLIEKSLAISQIISNASRAIAQATANLAAVPAVIGVVPNPLYAVQAAATTKGIATTKISAALSIAQILAQTVGKISGQGSISASGNIGQQGSTTQAQAPQFNIVGQNTNNQLANTIAGQQNRPLQAYVVGNEVSTQQALDRNRIDTATFN